MNDYSMPGITLFLHTFTLTYGRRMKAQHLDHHDSLRVKTEIFTKLNIKFGQ